MPEYADLADAYRVERNRGRFKVLFRYRRTFNANRRRRVIPARRVEKPRALLRRENEFYSLAYARDVIESWRQDYNAFQPHKSLGNRTPEEFARDLEITDSLHLSAA